MLSKLIILALVVVWAIVLVPDVLRRFTHGRRSDTIGSFTGQLRSLARANGQHNSNVIDLRTKSPAVRPVRASQPAPTPVRRDMPASAPSPSPGGVRRVSPAVRKRRQDILVALGSASVITLLATVSFGGAFLFLHLLVDVLLITYLVLLAQVTGAVPSAAIGHRSETLAPASPLHSLRTGSVGDVVPAERQRVAN